MSGILGIPYAYLPLIGSFMLTTAIAGAMWFNPFNQARLKSWFAGKVYGVMIVKGKDRRGRFFVRKWVTGELVKIGKAVYQLPELADNLAGVPVAYYDEGDVMPTTPKLMPERFEPIWEEKDEIGADGKPTGKKTQTAVGIKGAGRWLVVWTKDDKEKSPNSAVEVDNVLVKYKITLEAEAAKTFMQKLINLLTIAAIAGGSAATIALIGAVANYVQTGQTVILCNQSLQQTGTAIKMLTTLLANRTV